MHLVLDIATSAEFWRKRYPLDRSPQSAWATAPSDCAHRKEDVWALAPDWITAEFLAPLDGKLHALAFDRSLRRKSDTHITHTWSDFVPPKSFHKLDQHVLIMSPCFMFLMAASILSMNALIAFGDELCGLYSFDTREERGFRKRKIPLTTTNQLRKYLNAASRANQNSSILENTGRMKAYDSLNARKLNACRGYDRAMTALRYVINGSASPMETFDEMTICLPYRIGGYSFPSIVMNHEVPLTEKAARVALRKTCYADMCYPVQKLDIEHHGKLDHSSPEDVASDYARKAGLREMGYEVIELTSSMVKDLEAYEIVIEYIAKRIGKRLDKSKLGPLPQRIKLRNEVFEWNRSSGRIR